MNRYGAGLRFRRQQLGLSQAKLAELSGVAQYLISAFELEKAELPPPLLSAVHEALSDKSQVNELATRSKRYKTHKYAKVAALPDRVARALSTAGNIEYRRLLDDLSTWHQAPKDRLSALSLFSGCGGFSLGFSAAGFRVAGYLEIDDSLRAIYRHNFPNSLELGTDITKVTEPSLSRAAAAAGEIDVIIGGPPCQGFSLSGKRQINDPRNTLFKHYLRFVDVFRPKVAVLENVRLLTSMKTPSGGFVRDAICSDFRAHGYEIACFEINAKDYGVPQHRQRVLFIAMRNDLGLKPTIPEPTHEEHPNMFSETSACRTFADACSDLPYLESGETSGDPMHKAVQHPTHVIEWLWDVREGQSAHENSDPNKRPPSGYNTTYKRQIWNEPASTVQTTFGMISGCRNVHPIATRSLTIREAARIQSFPDSYHFVGSLGVIRTGIGNAVPPLLAYRIGLNLKERLL